MEEYMAPSTSRRFFFTTYSCLYTVVTRPDELDINTIIDRFCNNLENEVQGFLYFKWADVDLVFFPICAHEHYYAVCFSFSTKSIAVIDNSKNGDDKNIVDKYGSIPKTLKMYFCHYLTKMDYHVQCKSIKYVNIKRLKMTWRTTSNAEDCGVFIMRHIECYNNEREQDWKCGLTIRSKGVLQRLRGKYCSTLMLSETNHESLNNSMITSKHYEECSKNMEIDIKKMIVNIKRS
ncbi:hypothetical protein AAHA92_17411 [Salvia divinorum]|uniref:Ubiquitin-like protease family profile domain-containing protein n=1 Tax=Salvia divinorum TaxID=28513 RepID=A0ABD1GZ74_SALDI